MIQNLSYSDISNEMSMLRSAFKGTFLVVEGATDCRLYSKFIDRDNVRIIVAHSKNNVMNSVSECRSKRHDKAVIGFVDRDLDTDLGRKRSPPLFPTDKRDMESTVLASPALDDVLAEYGDAGKIASFENKHGPIRDCIARSAAPLGILMYISYRKGMNLSFKDLDHSLFVNPHELSTDVTKLVAIVYSNSMAQAYPRAAIADMVRNSMSDYDDLWMISRGHDSVTILKLGLRFAFGSYNSRSVSDDALGGALRLAYSREYFEKTMLYSESGKWCEENGLALWNRDA